MDLKVATPESGGTGVPPPSGGVRAKSLTPEQIAVLTDMLRTFAADPGVQAMFRNIGQGIQRLLEAVKPFAGFIGTLLLKAGELMARLPEQLQVTVLALAARGWFFDHRADWADYFKATNWIQAGDVASADALMVQHFEKRLDGIESDLCARLPHRASKIRNALAAHRRGEFDLAVPALLAQADGICKELRGGHFFMVDRKTRRPETEQYFKENSNDVFTQVLHLTLVQQIPLKQQLRQRGNEDAGLLNRHAVMHGESLDFDTQANSLRALSLLNYVGIALDDPETEEPAPLVNSVMRSASVARPFLPPRT